MKKNLIILLISITALFSCNNFDKANLEESNEPQVYIAEGMFVFESIEHMETEMEKMNSLSFSEKEEWFEKFGVKTYGRVFTKVMLAEDSITNYFESLPIAEQEHYRAMPQIYSNSYKEAFNQGIIIVVTESDNSYYDVNLFDKTYADFVNLDGKIKLGSTVFQISECETEIYTDVKDEDLKRLDEFKSVSITEELKNDLKSADIYNWSEVKPACYYDRTWTGSPRKRVWAEILGESYMHIWLEGQSSTCCDKVYSNFVLKGFAQKKNFWGNWVFSGDFWPLIKMEGSWNYEYAYWNYDSNPNDNCLCGYYSSHRTYGYDDFPNYYCTPIHISYCPTSPIETSEYGNGWQHSVSPTGIFSYTIADGLWWAQPFRVYNLDINITVDGCSFRFT